KVFVAIFSTNIKYFVNFLSNLWVSWGVLRKVFFGQKEYDFKSWLRYGIPIWLKYWLGLIQNNIKPVLVGSFVGVFSGGVFKAASLISSGVYILEVSVSNVLFIELSKEIGRGNFFNSALRIRGITLKMSAIMGVFSLISAVLGVLVLRFFGKGYEGGGIILSVIILGYYINSLSGIWQAFLQASGRSDMVFLISLVYSVVDIGLVLMLIKPLGILGAALSFPISAVLITLLRFYLFYKISGVKPMGLKTLILSSTFVVLFLIIIPVIA
ncbi:MAG: polysaccharide biosynthesis C-terminal domain-containing protein, partial [candidate division WOR-3 bacterium]